MDRSKTNEGTGAMVYKWSLKQGHSFSLGLHTTAFQAEIYVIKACIMENIEYGYRGRNIFQINSKLVWDCQQSLVKLAEHNWVQLIWMPGHMGTDGNKVANQLARQGSSHPHIGPETALGISAKVATEVTSGWMKKKHKDYSQSIHGQKQAMGFLKRPATKTAGELLDWKRNQLQ
jgi:hypothetical protein